jgi:hypothetical protein
MNKNYLEQVSLLVRILPEIAKIPNFALHGGTAINLFHHNMPRLSVDIDLTYVDNIDREKDLASINELLTVLSLRLSKIIPGIRMKTSNRDRGEYKLICIYVSALVKVEVNTITRGLISQAEICKICPAAQMKDGPQMGTNWFHKWAQIFFVVRFAR